MSAETSFSYAAFGPTTPLEPWTFELRPMGPYDVEMKLAYCGMCHSDLHTINGDWGDQKYPIVPGHELIGYVTKIGEKVTNVKVGQRIGVGPQASSCMKCDQCNQHRENYCIEDFWGTYGSVLDDGYITKGGYAHYNRTHCRFVVPIPDALPSAAAAPLLCAGVTTYAPLKYAKVGPGMKVGVLGIGGLGHLGLKFAVAFGAEVYALSTSESKREEVKKYGVTGFLNIRNKDDLKAHKRTFDMILNTASAALDLEAICKLIKPHGNLTTVGLPEEGWKLPRDCLLRHIQLTSTLIGSPAELTEMLEFCAKHNIVADIEILPLEKANEGFEKMIKNQVRYRVVLAIDEELDKKHQSAKAQN